ncbi:hypothetical protein PCC7418_1728 [Halothece sp. PCC 7418]|uniref:hypothetical protein n=1 Tax=Halothece sp. (strain PCC 7418) TaxID=65093 RepID=UPI0002A06A1B|nr:hypothetical protein [Halothece sp. PCC 7418]AFZ43897.1 hypothetical protein PCC7418_1728 [Halothece sp. PCC 7418]
MRSPTLTLALVLTILFVAIGDLFLPQPLAKASYRTRNQLNQLFVSLLPQPNVDHLQRNRFEEWEKH